MDSVFPAQATFVVNKRAALKIEGCLMTAITRTMKKAIANQFLKFQNLRYLLIKVGKPVINLDIKFDLLFTTQV